MAGTRHANAHTVTGNAYVSGDLDVGGDIFADDITVDVATAATVTVTDVNLANDMTITNAGNLILGTGAGTQIGTGATQKLGFYGAAPIAKATGVAVTAEAIHAALVNLGLIGA